MKKQKLVLVRQFIKTSNTTVYKWVSEDIAKNIVNNSSYNDINFEYASWYATLFFRLKALLFDSLPKTS